MWKFLGKKILLGLDRGVWYYNIQEICKKCNDLEFNGIEVQIEHPEIFQTFPEIGNLRKTLENFNIKHISIHGPIKDINISSYNPRIRRTSIKELKETIKFASKLSDNILYLVIHGGQNSFRSPSQFEKSYLPKAMEYTIDTLKELMKDCEEFGIQLSIENMTYSPWRLSSKLKFLDQIFMELPTLKFTFDYAHGLHGSERYSFRILKNYINRLISVHIGNLFEVKKIYNHIKSLNPFLIIEPHHLTGEQNIFERLKAIIPKIRAL